VYLITAEAKLGRLMYRSYKNYTNYSNTGRNWIWEGYSYQWIIGLTMP